MPRKPQKYKELTNQRFGRLVILEKIPSRKIRGKTRSYWRAKCDCGNFCDVPTHRVTQGYVKSCGCLVSTGFYNKNFQGFEEISLVYWKQIIIGAKQRELDFSISIEEIWDLFIKQNRKCALSGLDISFHTNDYGRNRMTASLDRIDSSKGYISGNIQWVHKDINKMKMNFTENRFLELIEAVFNNKINVIENHLKE